MVPRLRPRIPGKTETKKRHRPEEIHLELRANVALVLLLDGAEKIDRRVVDENVDASEARLGLLHRRDALFGVRDVER